MSRAKFLLTLLAIVLCVAMVTSCASPSTPPTDTAAAASTGNAQAADSTDSDDTLETPGPSELDISQAITLKYYFIGDEGGNFSQEGLDYQNELLKEKINATLDPLPISWGDWRQKIPIILASGESFDMIYTANWAFYFTEGAKGAYMPLDDLMPTYAPTRYEHLITNGIDKDIRVNGKICMVPNLTEELTKQDLVIREDLRKKYNVPEINSVEDFEVYMEAIKANEPEMLPLLQSSGSSGRVYNFLYDQDWGRPIVGGDFSPIVYNLTEGIECFSYIDTPEYRAFLEQGKSWLEKGYWSRSVLSDTANTTDAFYAGQTAAVHLNYSNINTVYKRLQIENPEWEIAVHDFDVNAIERVAPANNGTAIGANSKNPERSLMFLELLFNDQEMFDAIVYGVEGIHYVLTEDGKTRRPDNVDASVNLGMRNLGMGLNIPHYMRQSAEDWQWCKDMEKELWGRGVYPALAGFSVNLDNISAEVAMLATVITEYKLPLDFGLVDPEEGLPTLIKKLDEAGIEKIIQEINGQLTVYNQSR